jgi:lipopolysaccharide/colanic/teichoic acid biosynthesis glycosyltransferase
MVLLTAVCLSCRRKKEDFTDSEHRHHSHHTRQDEHAIGRLFSDVSGFFFLIIVLAIALIPVYIAVKCNPEHPVMYGILAFLFSEIYLIQFLVRKFAIKSPGYCSAI